MNTIVRKKDIETSIAGKTREVLTFRRLTSTIIDVPHR